jgi:flagellin-like protein
MKRRFINNEEAVSPVIAVILMVAITVVMAAVLYAWVANWGLQPKSSPTGSMMASEDGSGVWDVQIIKMNPQASITSVNWYLMDVQSLTIAEGSVTEIYGYKSGEGQSILYIDNDYNAKVSPGDIFRFYPGEGTTLADYSSLDDFSFRIKYHPTSDTIGYDVDFNS